MARGAEIRLRRALLQRFGTLGIFVALVGGGLIWSPSFLTKPNVLNVLRQVASSAGIMAVGCST